jgi:hypothetical protein
MDKASIPTFSGEISGAICDFAYIIELDDHSLQTNSVQLVGSK